MSIDILQFFAELITSIFKHGLSLTTFAVAVTALLRVQFIRNKLSKRLPRRFRHEDKLDVIQRDIKAIKEHLGVKGWDADSTIGRIEPSVITGTRKKSLSQPAAYAPVTIARYFTRLKETYHLSQRRMSMKSKLLSRKLWMTILGSVILVLNQQLGWNLNADSIASIGTLFISFILGQSIVDTNGMGQFAPLLEKLKSSKLWVALIGSVVIVLNDEYQWGLTSENIYIIVGLAVSFIFGKSAASVVQASKNSGFDETKTH